jgi:hypothetical protein
MTEVGLVEALGSLVAAAEALLFVSNEMREKSSALDRSSVSVSTDKCSGEGSFRGGTFGWSESEVSDPESVESPELRRLLDLDRPRLFRLLPPLRLRLLVVEDAEENEVLELTDRSRRPLMDAGDLGGRWLGANLEEGGVGGLSMSPLAFDAAAVDGKGCCGIDGPITTPIY